MNVIKEGENQAISLFNTLVKSDFGAQLIGQITPHLKNYMAENMANNTKNTETTNLKNDNVIYI